MTKAEIRKKFPANFPVELLPEGAKEQSIAVFRVCRTGKADAESFLPTYLDITAYTKENVESQYDCGYYSLSTYEKKSDAKRIHKLLKRRNPPAILAKGETNPDCGPSQRTKERTGKKTSHVDWWLYEGAEPHKFFSAVEESEESP